MGALGLIALLRGAWLRFFLLGREVPLLFLLLDCAQIQHCPDWAISRRRHIPTYDGIDLYSACCHLRSRGLTRFYTAALVRVIIAYLR